MKYLVEKDEMGVINYYNLEKKLLMQEYQTVNDTIILYYHDKKIVKIKSNNLELDLDLNGNISIANFNNGVIAYFINNYQKVIFLDNSDGEYLGIFNMPIEPICGSNRIYIIDKIINNLNEIVRNLIENKYLTYIENINDKIHKVNNEIVLETVAILSQNKRHSIEKILNDYKRQELKAKKFLNLIKKRLSKEKYNQIHSKITMKYAIKRYQLKKRYNYLDERRKLEELKAELLKNQNSLNELLLEKKAIYNEYLTR